MRIRKALLVLDAQVAMFNLSKPLYNSEAVLDNVRSLIERARVDNAPVVYLRHSGKQDSVFAEGSPGWQIHPSIFPRRDESVIEKHKADAFLETELEQCLRQLSVQAVVVCGFVTEGCIDTTVRRASSLGFQVELAKDAHSTTDGQVLVASQIVAHHNYVLGIFGAVKASNEIRFA
jgi:nicotinamidase-related amidase